MKRIILIVFLILITNTVSVNAFFVGAETSILMDIDSNRVIFEKNMNKRMKTASIAKVMTAIVAIENGFLDEYVKVSKESVNQIGSKIYLIEDDEIMLLDLIYGLMLRSGNDSAYLIAESVLGYDKFVIEMNEYAKRIGMKNSTFENPSGLDENSINYSTAYDMALLMSYAMKNDVFRDITKTRVHSCTTKNDMRYVWSNKHRLVQSQGIYTGGKTGYTKSAGRTLITTASDGDLDLVVVTFNGSNDWNDHSLLFNYGFDKFDKYTVMKSQALRIKNNLYDYKPYIEKDITVPLRVDERDEIDLKIYLKHNSDSYVIGKIIVYLNNEIIIERNVYNFSMEKSQLTFFDFIKKVRL
ncbi:D-alanyl-D-alanine carboxypeptidase family protein [Mycoplasmatota bacterium zrk1]